MNHYACKNRLDERSSSHDTRSRTLNEWDPIERDSSSDRYEIEMWSALSRSLSEKSDSICGRLERYFIFFAPPSRAHAFVGFFFIVSRAWFCVSVLAAYAPLSLSRPMPSNCISVNASSVLIIAASSSSFGFVRAMMSSGKVFLFFHHRSERIKLKSDEVSGETYWVIRKSGDVIDGLRIAWREQTKSQMIMLLGSPSLN